MSTQQFPPSPVLPSDAVPKKRIALMAIVILLAISSRICFTSSKDVSSQFPVDGDDDSDDGDVGKLPLNSDAVKDPFDLGPPVVITEGEHITSPPPTGSCSCWDEDRDCCERGIHPSHKFGHLLVTTLFGEGFNPNWNGEGYTRRHLSPDKYFNRSKDYREVFVTRDWYDALVSGYLYHRTGHECWINGHTGEIHPVIEKCKCREEAVLPLLKSPYPFSPFNGRDICKYLIEEDEYVGMRVYAEWVIRRYYVLIVETFKAVQVFEDKKHRKTLFVCFEDLANPDTKMAVAKQIVDWLYPGGQKGHLPPPPTADFTDVHATSHDVSLRQRLLSVVKEVDAQAFGGEIARLSDMFGCGKK